MSNEASGNSVSKNSASDTDNRLEAVKELLFGQNVQEYREEFKELKDQLKDQKEASDEDLKNLKIELSSQLNELEKKVDKMNDQIANKLDQLLRDKVDRKQLAKLFQNVISELDK